MIQNGYIKLHRSITGWEWYDDINAKVVFLHLLLTVNPFDQNWHGKQIRRGQRAVTLADLAEELHISIDQLRTALNKLERTTEITRSKIGKIGLITVVNYDKYQSEAHDNPTEIPRKSHDNPTVIPRNKEYKESKNISHIAAADNIIISSARVREGEALPHETYRKYFGDLPRIAAEELNSALTDGMEAELVRKIIEETAAAEANSPIKYMRSIIGRCRKEHITTAEQFAKAKERGAVPGRGAGHVAKQSCAGYDLAEVEKRIMEDEQ